MSRRLALLLLGALAGCSGLQETEAGVVQLDVTVPGPDSVEVGESIQLSARPLRFHGRHPAPPEVGSCPEFPRPERGRG